MIKPTIGELLSGVAASLRERVLPEIPAGTTRRQIQAAIGIIARVALVWDKTAPYLYADNEDIAQTLQLMLPVLERLAAEEDRAHIRALCTKLHSVLEHSSQPAQAYPSADELGTRNLALQEMLAEIQETLFADSMTQTSGRDELKAMLHALFHRMLTRELAITSPARRP